MDFPADGDVLDAIHTVMHLVRHRQMVGAGTDLNPMEAKVLGFFARNPGATQSALAVHSGRDKGQLARLVNGLKEKGLLQAQPDDKDRRVTCLTLTEPALAIHAQWRRQRKRLSAAAVLGLTEEEHRQLMVLLSRVRSNLNASG